VNGYRKLSKNNPFSHALSINAEANNGNRFKLLIPKPVESNNYSEIIDNFLKFLDDYHLGIKNEEDIGFNMDTRPPSGTLFVHMNPETKKIEWLDHQAYK
jgi:hypothetical protein